MTSNFIGAGLEKSLADEIMQHMEEGPCNEPPPGSLGGGGVANEQRQKKTRKNQNAVE